MMIAHLALLCRNFSSDRANPSQACVQIIATSFFERLNFRTIAAVAISQLGHSINRFPEHKLMARAPEKPQQRKNVASQQYSRYIASQQTRQLFVLSEEFVMVIDLFSKALETPPILSEPLIKANQLFAANLEKMVVFQMNVLQSYLNIGLNQMKAAAEINDLNSLQDFYKRQSEIVETMRHKLLIDTKAMSDLAARFKFEMDNLVQATLADILPKAA